jgi:hypothetical protein
LLAHERDHGRLMQSIYLSGHSIGNALFEKLHPFEGDRFRSFFNVSPDSCRRTQLLEGKTKPLDGQPSVIVQGSKGLKYFRPLHVPGAGDAPIVLARVHVFQLAPDCPVAVGNILLFDIGVKGVKQDANVRVTDLL